MDRKGWLCLSFLLKSQLTGKFILNESKSMTKNAMTIPLLIFFAVVLISFFSSCGGQERAAAELVFNEEIGQQVGDLMTSIDEMFLSGAPSFSVQTNSCSSVTFDSCFNNRRTKSFNGCSLRLLGTMTGLINLDFTPGTNCSLSSNGNQVTRTPNFNIIGRRGATFSVRGGTQVLTRNSESNFSFISTNIRRTVTVGSQTKLDLTTSTTSPLLIQGATRANRQITTGTFTIFNNLNNVSCSVTLQNLSWGASCSCPIQGSQQVSCSNGTQLTLTFTNLCGRVTLTSTEGSSTIDLDRCY
jgi:hypothetical protein